MSGQTLGALLETQSNSFNAVRLGAAGAVFISHAMLMLPFGAHLEPFDGSAYNLSQIAVNVFFFLSGLMLSRSYALRSDPARFALARIVRIFPGLLVCGMATAWIIGPLNTGLSLGAYFSSPETLLYPFSVPLLFNGAGLPGVFAFGVEPHHINTPLWTIKYELFAYIAFAAIAVTGLLPAGRRIMVVTLLLGIGLAVARSIPAIDETIVGSVLRFGFCFALGRAAYVHRYRIGLDMPLALLGIAISVPLLFSPVGALASILSASYFAAVLGSVEFAAWTRRTDLSYGIYLYAWPIQQALISRFAEGPAEALALGLLAAFITVCVAWLSWTLIERPALRLRLRTPRGVPVGAA